MIFSGNAFSSEVISQGSFLTSQNDLAIGTALSVEMSAYASGLEVTGFAGGEANRLLLFRGGYATQTYTLKHQSTSSAAANRLVLMNASDLLVFSLSNIAFLYNLTDQRWIQVGYQTVPGA